MFERSHFILPENQSSAISPWYGFATALKDYNLCYILNRTKLTGIKYAQSDIKTVVQSGSEISKYPWRLEAQSTCVPEGKVPTGTQRVKGEAALGTGGSDLG